MSINPDMGLSEALGKSWDVVVLPGGGPGAAALAASPEVISPSCSFKFLETCIAISFLWNLKMTIGTVSSDRSSLRYHLPLCGTFLLFYSARCPSFAPVTKFQEIFVIPEF